MSPVRDWLKKHWILPGIGLACLAGYYFPAAGETVGRYLGLLVGGLMFLMGLGIGFRRFRSRMRSGREAAFVLSLSYLVAPLVGWALARLFFSGQLAIFTGLILNGTTATTLSTCVIFTRLAGGDEALALWLSVLSSLVCTFISPVLLYFTLGSAVEVPVGLLIGQLFLVLFIPLSAGMVLRRLVGEARVAPAGPLLTRGCTLIVLIVVMVAVSRSRGLIGSSQGPILIAAAGGFHLAMLAGWAGLVRFTAFTPSQKIATLFCSVQKTLQVPAFLAIHVLHQPEAAAAPVVHHVIQLVVDSLLVSYLSSGRPENPAAEAEIV